MIRGEARRSAPTADDSKARVEQREAWKIVLIESVERRYSKLIGLYSDASRGHNELAGSTHCVNLNALGRNLKSGWLSAPPIFGIVDGGVDRDIPVGVCRKIQIALTERRGLNELKSGITTLVNGDAIIRL